MPRRRRARETPARYGTSACYVIAGPNGAGKTTFAREFLKSEVHCPEFVNADLIAAGLSPLEPRRAALAAGKLMLAQMRSLAAGRRSFGFETTLSGLTYARFLRRLKEDGYVIRLFFLWLPGVDLALKRILDRVRHGGHDVPEPDVRRRFSAGMVNLFKVYRPLADEIRLFDNTETEPRCIAQEKGGRADVYDVVAYERLKEMAGAR